MTVFWGKRSPTLVRSLMQPCATQQAISLDLISCCPYGQLVNQPAHPAESPGPGLLKAGPVAIGGQPATAAEPVPGALAIGIDIECSDNLPPSGDPWSEPFYLENFTPAEIDWCLRQPDSQLSFCSLWSAKEAAMKCGRELAALRRIEIEVRHDERGRPMLRATRASHQALASDCVLSISHSGKTGIAVCVRKPASRGPGSKPDTGKGECDFI
jgi:phosphopantetheine--protein transferase-like protein